MLDVFVPLQASVRVLGRCAEAGLSKDTWSVGCIEYIFDL